MEFYTTTGFALILFAVLALLFLGLTLKYRSLYFKEEKEHKDFFNRHEKTTWELRSKIINLEGDNEDLRFIIQRERNRITDKEAQIQELKKKYTSVSNSINSALSRVPDELRVHNRSLSWHVSRLAKCWNYQSTICKTLLDDVQSEVVIVFLKNLEPVFSYECSGLEFEQFMQRDKTISTVFGEYDSFLPFHNASGELTYVFN